jgi:hypothetical protein
VDVEIAVDAELGDEAFQDAEEAALVEVLDSDEFVETVDAARGPGRCRISLEKYRGRRFWVRVSYRQSETGREE